MNDGWYQDDVDVRYERQMLNGAWTANVRLRSASTGAVPLSFGYPPWQAPSVSYSQPTQGHGLGIASMILGIIGTSLCLLGFLALPFGLVGLPLGAVALVRASSHPQQPRGMPITGVVLSSTAIFLSIVVTVIYLSL